MSTVVVGTIERTYSPRAWITLYEGDCLEFLACIPDGEAHLVVTSPPYNMGKTYETRVTPEEYLTRQEQAIAEAVRVVAPQGSICWQVGNYVENGEVYPLDVLLYPAFKRLGLYLRNRIVWSYGHGLHCRHRFSGRYETILWFTKAPRHYQFNLDRVRVPAKYPGKRHWRGPRAGQYSGNPLGKNPGDVWDIPNVKHNHVEKTVHPCQYPVELVERLVLALTEPGQLVVDPYIGVGTTAVAAILHGRRAAGSDLCGEYLAIAESRVRLAAEGNLPVRKMGTPVYVPPPGSKLLKRGPS